MKIESIALAGTQAESDSVKAPLKKAVQEFESFFLGQMMKDMRKTVPEGGLFGHAPEEDMMRDLLDEEWGKQMATGRGVGLSQVLFRQLQQHP